MLKKYEVLEAIGREKIVGIIRSDSREEAMQTLEAICAGGLTVVELSFTTPYAHEILAEMTKTYRGRMLIGAGTILDAETARIAILSGAAFLVTPTVDPAVIRLANRYSIPCLVGVATPTELAAALENGADVVKLFPAGSFRPGIVRDLKAPFPNVEIVPTGGVSLANFGEWLEAGAYACGISGELVAGARTGEYARVTEAAKAFRRMAQG